MTTHTQITGKLMPKWIASYFKRSGMDVQVSLYKHADGSESLLLKNSFVLIHAPRNSEMLPYSISEWEHSTFPGGKGEAQESNEDISSFWYRFATKEYPIRLEVTQQLHETPGSDRKKPGTFFRRFRRPDGQFTYLQKAFCDFLSPDLSDLSGFLFEQENGPLTVVRVSSAHGYVGYLSPADLKGR